MRYKYRWGSRGSRGRRLSMGRATHLLRQMEEPNNNINKFMRVQPAASPTQQSPTTHHSPARPPTEQSAAAPSQELVRDKLEGAGRQRPAHRSEPAHTDPICNPGKIALPLLSCSLPQMYRTP